MNSYDIYIIKRFRLIRKHLNNFRETQHAEDLHQYRVEFKKLKALYLLINYCNPELKAEKEFRKIKKSYKESGYFRDAEVIQTLLKQNNISVTTTDNEKTARKNERKLRKFCKHIHTGKTYSESLKKKLLKKTSHLSITDIAAYMAKIKTELKYKLLQPEIESVLHDIRKDVKQLIYISNLEPGIIDKKRQNSYNKLQELIGNWNDKIILVNYLEKEQPNIRRPINSLLEKSSKELRIIQSKLAKLIF